MKIRIKPSLFFVVLVLLLGCRKVPMTGRTQLAMVPESEMIAMSAEQYDEVLKQADLSDNEEQVAMVKSVGKKMQRAVEEYMRQNNMTDQLTGYKWEFNLLESEQANAWAMPGGKVAFYEGIMPICKDENGVAVVMGHEVSHAIARHGNERMSQGLMREFGAIALATALQQNPGTTQALAMQAYGMGTEMFGILPFSRKHESEADHMGLIFMAMAGYDPRGAVDFWKRMKTETSGGEPPEFLSTHPSHDTRIKDLNEHMPEALEYYKPGK